MKRARRLTAALVVIIGACSSSALSEAEAVDIARGAAPQSADYPIQVAEAGPASELVADTGMAEDVPGDRWVWYIVLGTGGYLSGGGTVIVIDYIDGRVYDVVDVIA